MDGTSRNQHATNASASCRRDCRKGCRGVPRACRRTLPLRIPRSFYNFIPSAALNSPHPRPHRCPSALWRPPKARQRHRRGPTGSRRHDQQANSNHRPSRLATSRSPPSPPILTYALSPPHPPSTPPSRIPSPLYAPPQNTRSIFN